jgi:hypothetical protein
MQNFNFHCIALNFRIFREKSDKVVLARQRPSINILTESNS